jgi:hypothetical protein
MARAGMVASAVVVLIAGCLMLRSYASAADDASSVGGDARKSSGKSSGRSSKKSYRTDQILEIKQELRALEQRVEGLETENADLRKTNAQLKEQTQTVQTTTSQQIQTLQSQVTAAPTAASFSEAFNRYLGRYRFTIVGGAAGSFVYDRQSNVNSFALDLEPIILWQISDRMLFEGTIEANLPSGSSADYQLPVATLQYFLNDYMTLQMGMFDQPFGNWFEDQGPFWVNRFTTSPLPYGVNGIVPSSEVGVQLRGGFQWGATGQIADYTIMTGNGPGFANSTCSDNVPPSVHPSCPPASSALVGDTLGSNNIRLNTHTPSFGGRIRVYPLPIDSRLGRLELGASTYDGKWLDGFWFNAWGVDFNYFKGNLQTRGEWIQTYRQMPSPQGNDNRQGWYVQAGYFLTGLKVPGLPSEVDQVLSKFEPLVRYSGINQRATVQSAIITSPEIGFTGSPAVFMPHAREVALGLDYWFAPSVVWQNEFDLELPGQGGFYSDTGQPIHATANDRAFTSQFAIGF